jgi:hypothetical protein
MTDRRMDIHKPELWFNKSAFLGSKPPTGWTVDWDHIDGATEMCTEECEQDWPAQCRVHKYMGGILIKHVASGRVWRLTGEKWEREGHGVYCQGRWPD